MTAPVLLLIFNRPQVTDRVFEAIRRARPQALYIAADGPRADRPGENELCARTREVTEAVDWPCRVHRRYRDNNLGCRTAVVDAIDWFFANEEAGIILEDDCLVSDSFFAFASEMLGRYVADEAVMSVSAAEMGPENSVIAADYRFSRFSLMWGWATWRRAWGLYEGDMNQWPTLRDTGWLKSTVAGSTMVSRSVWRTLFDMTHAGEIDTWDYQWIYTCWLHRAFSIAPAHNLVTNLGIGPEAAATHTMARRDPRTALQRGELQFPLDHPDGRLTAPERDAYINRHWFEASAGRQLVRRLVAADSQWLGGVAHRTRRRISDR